MDALDRDAVAEVLLKHRVHFAYGEEAGCHCGASVLIPGMGGDLEDPLWTTHQADAIVELVRPVSEVKAEAVRDAERRMFGTTDGDMLPDDSDLPVGELRRLLWVGVDPEAGSAS